MMNYCIRVHIISACTLVHIFVTYPMRLHVKIIKKTLVQSLYEIHTKEEDLFPIYKTRQQNDVLSFFTYYIG